MVRVPRQLIAGAVLLLAIVLLAGGCAGRVDDPATVPNAPDAPERGEAPLESADATSVVPPRIANEIGRRLDGLVAAYVPVSSRSSFLVAAETLRSTAVDSGAGTVVELERAGSVRVEIGRMRPLLTRARANVDAVRVASPVQQRIKRRMLAAIDARQLALDQLQFALDGVAAALGDQIIDERFDRWQTSWDVSLRAAREATTLLQDERVRIGLEPSPEESIR
jgi:hypothetical protein